jgi:polyhydroxyalkanoate synthesis regulator phasin
MQDAWRAYLEMALGLTEAPRKKAQKAVSDLVNRGGATAAQLQGLAEDLMSTGMANREALTNIVRYEVDKALGVVGLATADEVSDLTARVRDLEKQLREAQARATAAEAVGGAGPAAGGARRAAGAGGGIGGERLNRPAPMPGPAVKKVAKKAVTAPPNQMPNAATTPSAPAKKAARKAVPKATPPAPAGTADSPVAGVRDAAAATELPAPSGRPAKKAAAAKKTPAKKAAKKAPAKKAAADNAVPPASPDQNPASPSAEA